MSATGLGAPPDRPLRGNGNGSGSTGSGMLGDTFRVGRVGGVTIGVNWSVLIIVALLAWSLAAGILPDSAPGHSDFVYWIVGTFGAVGLLASVLLHELCHAITANRHGVRVEHLTLWMFGGVTKLERQASDARTELLIALAGPAASVAIGGVLLVAGASVSLLGGSQLVAAPLEWLGAINLVLAVFNLLPGAPLDGGRVLAAVLWMRTGDASRARHTAAETGKILGQVLVALGVVEFVFGAGVGGLWLALIGWFLTSSAHAEQTQTEWADILEGIRVADIMSTSVHTVGAERTVADLVRHEAVTTHVSSFPVVEHDGRLCGLVTLRRLRRVPRDAWETTTLREACVPLSELAVAAPDEALLDVLRRGGSTDGRILVVTGGALVGIVTPTDISSALEGLALRRRLERP